MHLGSSSFTHSPLVNGFGIPATRFSPRSSLVARHIISAGLQHHAHLSTKVTNSDDPDLQLINNILGHLPPADMLLKYHMHCSAFPMATQPTIEQLNNAPQPTNPATTLAVNCVICQDLPTNHLEQINIPDRNSQYSSIKYHFIPIHMNTYIFSINLLPNHKYQLYRVSKTIDVIDSQHLLPQISEPTMVHTQRTHPTPLDLQLRCLSQKKKHTPSLSSMIQAISPSSSITKMALLNPTLQPQFNIYSRHKRASL
jgi:hypothetical protein